MTLLVVAVAVLVAMIASVVGVLVVRRTLIDITTQALADRADVILYMNQQGSNQPLPPPPAAAPAGKEGAAPAEGNTVAPEAGGNTTAGNPSAASGAPSNDPNAAKRAPK